MIARNAIITCTETSKQSKYGVEYGQNGAVCVCGSCKQKKQKKNKQNKNQKQTNNVFIYKQRKISIIIIKNDSLRKSYTNLDFGRTNAIKQHSLIDVRHRRNRCDNQTKRIKLLYYFVFFFFYNFFFGHNNEQVFKKFQHIK